MAYHRYTQRDVDSLSRGLGIRLRNEGESATIIPYYGDDDEPEGFWWPRHFLGKGAKPAYAPCLKIHGPETPCPLCESGSPQDWRASFTVWDVSTGQRRFVDGVPAGAFRELCSTVKALRAKKQDVHAYMFELTRGGKAENNKIKVTAMIAADDAKAKALHMLSFEPEEMVPDAGRQEDAEASPDLSDVPPPDDKDLPF